MQTKRFITLTLACLPFLVFGCVPKTDAPIMREFYFSSGGAFHIEGYGEWSIKLDQDGNFAITHNVQGETTDYGMFALSAEEHAALWDLVDAADINKMKSSERLRMPDEVQYTLSLTEGGSRHEVQIWIDEARDSKALTQLVMQIGYLIERYTGQQPVLN